MDILKAINQGIEVGRLPQKLAKDRSLTFDEGVKELKNAFNQSEASTKQPFLFNTAFTVTVTLTALTDKEI